LWNDENEDVIKFHDVVEAESLEDALEKTDRNLEMNVVIPLNEDNKKILAELIKEK